MCVVAIKVMVFFFSAGDGGGNDGEVDYFEDDKMMMTIKNPETVTHSAL